MQNHYLYKAILLVLIGVSITSCTQEKSLIATQQETSYRQLADDGDCKAQLALGQLLEKKQTIENKGEALKWYQKSVQCGNNLAYESYYRMSFYHLTNANKNVHNYFNWLLEGAGSGNQWAQLYVGRAYELGLYVTEDRIRALKWYKRSAAQGNTQAASFIE